MLGELREQKGLSQSQLAKASGISVRTIQAYEQGARKLSGASYDNLKKLSDALGVTIEELVK
jgi:transcriptional regulator with XRE-family HTH domain